jgi:hypothetical protein
VFVGEWSLSVATDVQWNDDWNPNKDENKDFYLKWWAAQVMSYEKTAQGWVSRFQVPLATTPADISLRRSSGRGKRQGVSTIRVGTTKWPLPRESFLPISTALTPWARAARNSRAALRAFSATEVATLGGDIV